MQSTGQTCVLSESSRLTAAIRCSFYMQAPAGLATALMYHSGDTAMGSGGHGGREAVENRVCIRRGGSVVQDGRPGRRRGCPSLSPHSCMHALLNVWCRRLPFHRHLETSHNRSSASPKQKVDSERLSWKHLGIDASSETYRWRCLDAPIGSQHLHSANLRSQWRYLHSMPCLVVSNGHSVTSRAVLGAACRRVAHRTSGQGAPGAHRGAALRSVLRRLVSVRRVELQLSALRARLCLGRPCCSRRHLPELCPAASTDSWLTAPPRAVCCAAWQLCPCMG